jgi:hypothetical protein
MEYMEETDFSPRFLDDELACLGLGIGFTGEASNGFAMRETYLNGPCSPHWIYVVYTL